MVKFICDLCGKELNFNEVIKMETKVKSNNALINEKLTINDFVLTETCVPCAKKFLGEDRINMVVARHKDAEEKMVGGYKPRFVKRGEQE